MYFDSLYYNESFLLVNLIFKAKPPIVGYPHPTNVWIYAYILTFRRKGFFLMKSTNRLEMLALVIMAYWKDFGCIIFGLLSFFTNKCWKIVDFWKTPEYRHNKYHIKAWKIYRNELWKYLCFFLVLYDSLYSNETFLLVDFGFQGQALYDGGLPSRECVNFRRV